MTIKEIIKQPEGRRLEFKEVLPENVDLVNTIIAFANDAGGELYIGIRNKVIAPVFKRMGIIDQWGNGLKLIADELKEYPQIDFRWKETGLSFQVQFVKLDYVAEQELQGELNSPTMYSEVLSKILETPLSRKEISEVFGQKKISGQLEKVLSKLIEDKLIENTISGNKNHPKQKLRITERGVLFLELLKK